MARLLSNGSILVSLACKPDGVPQFHVFSNGHILQRRTFGGWRQWAIVPIDATGSVVAYMVKHRGYFETTAR